MRLIDAKDSITDRTGQLCRRLSVGLAVISRTEYIRERAHSHSRNKVAGRSFHMKELLEALDIVKSSYAYQVQATNTMLDQAVRKLKNGEKPIVHTDRGCHYRWPSWIGRMERAGLTRSMSKKGCSPNNAACEGFFGKMKNEMGVRHFFNKLH